MENICDMSKASTVLTAHPFSKCNTLLESNTKKNNSTSCHQYLAPPGRREFQSCESLQCRTNLSNVYEVHPQVVEFNSSMEFPCYLENTKLNYRTPRGRHCIRHSKSLTNLNNGVVTRSLHKEYQSFNSLISSSEEDYVVNSIYCRAASKEVNEYLKLLSDCNDYEEIDDKSVQYESISIEPDYCVISGIDAY